jgi:hypothetical protein
LDAELEVVAEVPLLHLEVQVNVAEDDVAEVAMLSQDFNITSSLSSATTCAGMTFVHSGHSDSVFFRRPRCHGLIGAHATIVSCSGFNLTVISTLSRVKRLRSQR